MIDARQRRRRLGPSAPRTIGSANDNRPDVANDHDTPRPVVLMLSGLPVVSCRPLDELTPGEQARVARIEAAQRGRNHREAARLALEFEAALGITAEERIAALAPANDLDRAIDAALGFATAAYAESYVAPPPPKREKRLKGVKKPKAVKVDPLEGLLPGDLTQDEIDRLTTADADLSSPSLDVRAKAKTAIASIQRSACARANKAEVSVARAEVFALEALRGSVVEQDAKAGSPIVVASRDGLETLSATRTRKDGRTIPPLLTRIQFVAGTYFRKDYEMADPEKKLTPPDPDRLASHGGGGDGWAEKQMEIQRRIWSIHLMIAGVEVRDGARSAMPALPERHPARRAIHVLNEVAGKGTNLWNLSRSGSVRFRNSEALKRALDVAAIVYGLE